MHDHHLLLGGRHDVGGEDELTEALLEKAFRVRAPPQLNREQRGGAYGRVLLLRTEALLLDPRHVEDVRLRQRLLDAVELLLYGGSRSVQADSS